MKIIKPNKLNDNSNIGIVSPSSSIPADVPQRFWKGVENIKKLGYSVTIGKSALKKLGYMSGTPKERANDINEMFENKDVSAIFTSIGGYNSNQLLDILDYNIIKKFPKIFMGYSDTTALLLAIYKKTGMVTFHGPAIMPQFGESPQILNYTLDNMKKILTQIEGKLTLLPAEEWTDEYLDWSKGIDNRPRKMVKSSRWKILKEGVAKGVLIGGNLQTIQALIGTDYLPSFKKSIFFWEETESSTAEIDRTLTQFKQIGILDEIEGMLIGRLDRSVKITDASYDIEKIVLNITKEFDFSILSNLDFGHTDPAMTIPIGIEASFDTASQQVLIEGNAVVQL